MTPIYIPPRSYGHGHGSLSVGAGDEVLLYVIGWMIALVVGGILLSAGIRGLILRAGRRRGLVDPPSLPMKLTLETTVAAGDGYRDAAPLWIVVTEGRRHERIAVAAVRRARHVTDRRARFPSLRDALALSLDGGAEVRLPSSTTGFDEVLAALTERGLVESVDVADLTTLGESAAPR